MVPLLFGLGYCQMGLGFLGFGTVVAFCGNVFLL